MIPDSGIKIQYIKFKNQEKSSHVGRGDVQLGRKRFNGEISGDI